MKDSKAARLRRGAMALRQQFTNPRDGVFSRVLGDAEIAALVTAHVKDYRERIYPPLDTPVSYTHLDVYKRQISNEMRQVVNHRVQWLKRLFDLHSVAG